MYLTSCHFYNGNKKKMVDLNDLKIIDKIRSDAILHDCSEFCIRKKVVIG